MKSFWRKTVSTPICTKRNCTKKLFKIFRSKTFLHSYTFRPAFHYNLSLRRCLKNVWSNPLIETVCFASQVSLAMTGFPFQSGLERLFSFSFLQFNSMKRKIFLINEAYSKHVEKKYLIKTNNNFVGFEKIHTFAPQNEM